VPARTESIDETVVRKAPIFQGLDEAASNALRTAMSPIKLRKGQVLFKEGDDGDHLYIVTNGKIKLGTKAADGRENLLMILGPGDMFGDLSLFDAGPRTATATAVTESRLLSLGQNKVMPWVKEHPEVSVHLLARLASRLRRTNEVVGDLVFSDVPGRVAKALVDLGIKFGEKKEDGLLVAHDLTQEELAQLVGASRETVNKALADFAGRGWIRLEARAVMILDYERLLKRGR
jgi:CRP/FNR family cyclic AMP-dependent transcriptional regulator